MHVILEIIMVQNDKKVPNLLLPIKSDVGNR